MTTAEADRLGSSDDSQLIWATEQRRVNRVRLRCIGFKDPP